MAGWRGRLGAVLERGIDPRVPERLARRVRMANVLALLACAVPLLSLPFDLVAAPRWVSVEDVVAVPIYLGLYALNGRGWFRVARVSLIVFTCLTLLVTAALLGSRSGQQQVFFALVAMPFLLFDLDEWPLLVPCAALPIGCYFGLALGGYRLAARLFPREARPGYALYSAVVTFAVLAAGMAYFLRTNARAERALRDRERLLEEARAQSIFAAKMAALGEMASGIAHEINNPLTAIMLAASRVTLAARAGDQAGLHATVDRIKATVTRISKIVGALRFLARDAQGDPFAPADLGEVVDQTVELCGDRYRAQGIELTVEDFARPLVVECRAVQISQVLLNLLGNAHDAVEDLAEKWVRVAIRTVERAVEITVRDSGRGVPPALREKIFQPFFTTKEVGRGTGLGLSVSRGIVEAHHGELRLAVEDPHTCFVVRLPVAQPR